MAAVIITNAYQGFNTFSWNWWVLGSVLVGPVLILCYVAVYAAISPGWIWTDVYGLNTFLWPSAYFWFGLVFCFIVAFIPRYLTRYNKDWYNQADDTILKAVHRRDPNHDFVNDPMIPAVKLRQAYRPIASEDGEEGLPMQTLAQQGRRMTDATGNLVPVSSRGFAFVSRPSLLCLRFRADLSALSKDEDPYPRRSTSRPGSFVGSGKGVRPRSRSVKLGPVTVPVPSMLSPGSLRKKQKQRTGTVSTLAEQPEPETPAANRTRARTATGGSPGAARSAGAPPPPASHLQQTDSGTGFVGGQPVMHVISVDPPLSHHAQGQAESTDPFASNAVQR